MSKKHKPIYTGPKYCKCCDEPEEVCQSCGEEWPCEAWQQTKEYRIEQLSAKVAEMQGKVEAARMENRLRVEREKEMDRRLSAMEVYNQRLFDLGKQVARHEKRLNEKTTDE